MAFYAIFLAKESNDVHLSKQNKAWKWKHWLRSSQPSRHVIFNDILCKILGVHISIRPTLKLNYLFHFRNDFCFRFCQNTLLSKCVKISVLMTRSNLKKFTWAATKMWGNEQKEISNVFIHFILYASFCTRLLWTFYTHENDSQLYHFH